MAQTLHFLLLQLKHRSLNQDGQDLVEYALVAAMISLGAVAGMHSFASDIATTFTHLATTFNSNV